MYLLEFDENGVLYKITPDSKKGGTGVYVDKLPVTTEELLLTFNEIIENEIKKYIKKENE